VEKEEELRELQEERSELKSLQEHRGFKRLLELARTQSEARKQAVFLTPLEKMDEVLKQEYQKGEISGIELFRSIVDIQITNLGEEITRRLEDEQIDDETSGSSSAGGTAGSYCP
jgi:hypothetical protein